MESVWECQFFYEHKDTEFIIMKSGEDNEFEMTIPDNFFANNPFKVIKADWNVEPALVMDWKTDLATCNYLAGNEGEALRWIRTMIAHWPAWDIKSDSLMLLIHGLIHGHSQNARTYQSSGGRVNIFANAGPVEGFSVSMFHVHSDL